MPSGWRWFLRLALGFGVAFRLVGAIVNTEANDDHMEVIRVIATEHRMPAPDEFWESFQPPLYHLTAAGALMVLPPLTPEHEIIVAQGISSLAGLATLAILFWFLRALSLSVPAFSVTVALASLNPALITTSIQATNDAFVILFTTIALVAGYRFLRQPTTVSFAAVTAGAVLACLSKGNGLVVMIALLLSLAVAVVRLPSRRRQVAGYGAVFVLVAATVVPTAGGYLERRAKLGSAFATNLTPASPPALFTETVERRPGITSVARGFLTFPLVDMLRSPLIEPVSDDNDAVVYPRHRTSMWSLLYGGANSVHFAYYPESWRLPSPTPEWLVRATEVLALAPVLVLLAGVARSVARVVAGAGQSSGDAQWVAEMLLSVTAVGMVAFVAVYGFRYRDFATMKAIFICPAAVAFAVSFARELERLRQRHPGVLGTIAMASAGLLVVAYVLDVGALILWLSSQRMFLAIV